MIFSKPARRASGEAGGKRNDEGTIVGRVIMHDVVSLDGFIADDEDGVGSLHDWYFSGDTPLVTAERTDDGDNPGEGDHDDSGDGGGFRMSRVSAEYVRLMWESIGCLVIGRRLFDLMNGWEGQPPVGDHVVVVSHRPKPMGWHPAAPYQFVEDVTDAIATAQSLAGERVVSVNAGDVGSQILAAGLVDEVAMDVVPVVFGSGKRYFGSLRDEFRLDDPHLVIQGERVLHLRFKVSSTAAD